MSDHDRLTRLEEGYTHLQQHVTEQDKVIMELGEALARVNRELAVMRDRVASTGGGEPDQTDERPPHY